MSFVAKDGNNASFTLASEVISSVHYPKKYIEDGHNESLGAMADAAASTDTGTFSLISLFKRLLQSITTFSAKFANGAGLAATAVRVELPTDGTGKVGLNTGSNTIGAVNLAQYTPTSGKLPVYVEDAPNSGQVDQTNSILTSIDSTLGNFLHLEDAVAAGGGYGVPPLAIRNSSPSNLSSTNGDWEYFQMSAGRLWTSATIEDGGNSITVDAPVDNPTFVRLSNGSSAISILPVSGTVTANAGTNLNTSLLALESGGNLATIATSASLLDDAIVADDAAFTPSTTKVMMAGFEFDDSTPDSVNEGDAGAARMSANRVIYMQIRDAAGNERGANVDGSNRLSTIETNSGTIAGYLAGMATSILTDAPSEPPAGSLLGSAVSTLAAVSDVNITIGTGNGYLTSIDASLSTIDDAVVADDAAFTPATTKVMMAGFEFDDSTPDSVNEGDAGAARMSANRNIYTTLRDAAGNERGVNVDANGCASATVRGLATANNDSVLDDTNDCVKVGGNVAHDTTDSGNPQKVGGRALLTARTAVADADRTDVATDAQGRIITEPCSARELLTKNTITLTDTTETTLLAAVASTFVDLMHVLIANSSATDVRVTIRDTTGGSAILTLFVPQKQTVGFSSQLWPHTAVNTNWTAQLDTSASSVYVSAVGRKTK